MKRPLDIVVFGLSLSSSWGNGHATTFRALLRGLAAHGHRVLFLERDVPWYASKRDLPAPDFCSLVYYDNVDEVLEAHSARLRDADAVVIGSYVPSGIELIDKLAALRLKRFCFYDIDTPVTMAKLDRGDEDYLARRQIPLFDSYFSFSGGAVLSRLEREYGARHAEALYCSVDAERYVGTGEALQWDFGYLGTYSPDRQPTLERLLIAPAQQLPDRRFVVAGPQYPDTIEWPENVERIDHLPPAEHASFYSRQRFTLNVTRADMIAAGWSPSVRLFEAAACATAIISDEWQGLDELFPRGQAIFIALETCDVVELLSNTDEARRRAVASAARDIVLENHTGEARARAFAEQLSELPIHPMPRQRSLRSVPA
ncbi:CgeB family protein [Pararhizobium arenae]|uniref:CgeB family protein n=1 Tax=Pararhizobium arenae TaxID=1856850 RepID=UPI00094B3B9B|nr:glycosyltransferase [Pararhizobium arenae]